MRWALDLLHVKCIWLKLLKQRVADRKREWIRERQRGRVKVRVRVRCTYNLHITFGFCLTFCGYILISKQQNVGESFDRPQTKHSRQRSRRGAEEQGRVRDWEWPSTNWCEMHLASQIFHSFVVIASNSCYCSGKVLASFSRSVIRSSCACVCVCVWQISILATEKLAAVSESLASSCCLLLLLLPAIVCCLSLLVWA